MTLQNLLANFVFRDCRLESHPKIVATRVFVASRHSTLDLVAAVSKHQLKWDDFRVDMRGSIAGRVLETREAFVCSASSDDTPDFFKAETARSLLAAPILDGAETLGVVELMSSEKDLFGEKDIGRIQLLAALIAFVQSRQRKTSTTTEAAVRLGRALSDIRVELRLTQDELAYHGGFSRMALSQWERGRWG